MFDCSMPLVLPLTGPGSLSGSWLSLVEFCRFHLLNSTWKPSSIASCMIFWPESDAHATLEGVWMENPFSSRKWPSNSDSSFSRKFSYSLAPSDQASSMYGESGGGCSGKGCHRCRTAPNELSFASPATYKDIYGHGTKGEPSFLKSSWYDTGDPVPSVVTTRDPVNHSRQRRTLAHAFSSRSLKDHEHVIHRYTDLFITQLAKHGGQGSESINVSEAYNWLAFDIIGDLTFGESFNAVTTMKTNYWVSFMVNSAFFGTMLGLCKSFPQLQLFPPLILPAHAKRDYLSHRQLTRQKLERRIHQDDRTTCSTSSPSS